MGIFKKLFGSNAGNSNKTKKNEISDFFEIDIKNIPDETFTEIERDETNIKFYHKHLNYKECGIFDFVEVRVIDENNTNISFRHYYPDQIDFGKMKDLINEIYKMYGDDDDNKGKFIKKDISNYKDLEFNMLFGRWWSSYPKYKNPVVISRDDDKVEIVIWGVNE